MEDFLGLNSDPGEHSILVVSEEVHIILNFLRKYFSQLKNNVGFQVFSKNCANCHGMMAKKYDLLLDKAY